jgi:membrane-associated phospholipid phosphatase
MRPAAVSSVIPPADGPTPGITPGFPGAVSRVSDTSSPSGTRRRSPVVTVGGTYLALWAALSALTIGAGLVLTKLIVADGRGGWDADISRWLAVRRTGWLDDVTGAATAMANTMPVVGLTALTCLILLLLRKWPQALFVASALLFEVTVFLTANTLVERSRPDVPRMDSTPGTGSYPSGHTGASFAFWMALSSVVVWLLGAHAPQDARGGGRRVIGWLCIAIGAAIGLTIGFARLYRGMHYITDVTAGFLVGAGALVAAWIAVRVTMGVVTTARSGR